MWYPILSSKLAANSSGQKADTSATAMGYEEKIIRLAAERTVRRILALQGNYNPEIKDIRNWVERTIQAVTTQYGTTDNLRLAVDGNLLTPAVEGIVRDLLLNS